MLADALALTVGVDGDVAVAEAKAAKLPTNEAVRLAPVLQPSGQPLHLQRQIDDVHCATRVLLCHAAEFSRRILSQAQ